MRHQRKKVSIWCLLGICLFSSILFVLPVSAQDEAIPFVVGCDSGPGKLDPLDAYDSDSMDTIRQVCEGLYMYNYSSPEMEAIPCLADELGTWSVNGTGDLVILDVPLKEGVVFHDGTKFNASAVKWNFDRLQYWTYGWDVDGGDIFTSGDGVLESHPLGTASMSLFAQGGTPILNRTEIIDEYTIRFVLNLECVIWEKLLAFIACSMVLPDADYVYGSTFWNRIDINDELIGTGPFMLTEYSFDERVVFDYHPDYHMTWGDDHVERIIYLIVPDYVTRSLAILNHEIHWGIVDSDYQEQCCDPDLIELPVKRSVVYYIQMNLFNMKRDYRYASSLIWNHSYFLDDVLGGRHYELHVPVPDGMAFHHSGFVGEPEHDIREAQLVLLNSPDPEIQANITTVGLDVLSTTADWQAVAESKTPLAVFNYTGYTSGTVEFCGILLQDYLKNIGIKLNIIEPWLDWNDWIRNLEDPLRHKKLCYSFGGWGPDYNDPINMIEPLYKTGAHSNCFLLENSTWDDMLFDTYSLTYITTPTREEAFKTIQEHFCLYQIPSFYILQLGGEIGFNTAYLDEDSIDDLKNIMGDLYWFNVRFTPPDCCISPVPYVLLIALIGIVSISVVISIPVVIVRSIRRKKRTTPTKNGKPKAIFCPDCGFKIQNGLGMCDRCGKIVETDRIHNYFKEFTNADLSKRIMYCPICGGVLDKNKCTKCGRDVKRY